MIDIVKIVIVPIGAALLHDWLRSAASATRRALTTACAAAVIAGAGSWLAGWWTLPAGADGEPTRLALLALYCGGAVVVGIGYHALWRLWPEIDRWMPAAAMFGILFVTLITIAKGRAQSLLANYWRQRGVRDEIELAMPLQAGSDERR